MPASRRLLTALVAACVLPLGAGCSTAGDPTSRPADDPADAPRAAAVGAAPSSPAAPAPAPPADEQAAPGTGVQAPSPTAPTAGAPRPAPAAGRAAPLVAPLAELVLTRTDLGDGWLMERPDDEAADQVEHEFCDGPFASDGQRTGRIERNFAREDGTRVQQEVDRYASAAAAERAFAEFVDAFGSCAEYEPSPGARITMTPWSAPREAERRAGVEMTITTAGGPPVHAALAVYQTGDVLMVLSAVSTEQRAPAPFHVRLAPAAARRAHL